MALNIKSDQVIQNTARKPLPTIRKEFDPITRYLLDEIGRMQTVINQLSQAATVVADTAPTDPRKGTVRYAVSPWDPLGTGFTGLVVYDGTAWVAV